MNHWILSILLISLIACTSKQPLSTYSGDHQENLESLITLAAEPSASIDDFLDVWNNHYSRRLGSCTIEKVIDENEIREKIFICSPILREGNCPRIYYHGHQTNEVLVLTHGLSDSPWYMHFVAEKFYHKGLNVILPLLPAHGLKEPNEAMKDSKMHMKWKEELDLAVALAAGLGKNISLGGFSTGGALSYNKILRNPGQIQGGLFLFSGALSIGSFIQTLGKIGLVGKMIKKRDGVIYGPGPDPYKYGTFPQYGGFELAKIINENIKLEKEAQIENPVFAAHSVHDNTAKIEGILDILQKRKDIGSAFLVGTPVRHAEVPLQFDVPIDSTQVIPEAYKKPKANPQFEEMMIACLDFYSKYVKVSVNTE